MRIKESYILKAIQYFDNIYPEFNKRYSSKAELKEIIQVWKEIFDEIEFDYEEANEDFLKAVRLVIAENKFIPTPAEISNKMKKIFVQRETHKKLDLIFELQAIEEKMGLQNSDRTRSGEIYKRLRQTRTKEEIKRLMYQEKIKYKNLENNDTYDVLKNICGDEK